MWPGCVQTKPLLIRVDTKSGHGAGKPTSKLVTVTLAFYVVLSCVSIDIKPNTMLWYDGRAFYQLDRIESDIIHKNRQLS